MSNKCKCYMAVLTETVPDYANGKIIEFYTCEKCGQRTRYTYELVECIDLEEKGSVLPGKELLEGGKKKNEN